MGKKRKIDKSSFAVEYTGIRRHETAANNNHEAAESIRKGLKQAGKEKLERVKDLKEFLDKL